MLSRNLLETSRISRVTPKAPIQAAVTTPIFASNELVIETPKAEKPITKTATPSPAPELIPRIKGSANGFLKRVCICKPHTDRAAPANIAVIAFGIRYAKRILRTESGASPPVKAAITSFIGSNTDPSKRLRITRMDNKIIIAKYQFI